jgi:LacI family transcriptional regulator
VTERNEAASRRAVTLKDIAEASGVSVSTVSRILDERTPASRSATAQRVRALADDMGYRRNLFASNLRRGATATIGVLVPRLTDAVMALMFEAVERTARQRGYFAVVATAGDDPEDERLATETLLDRNVDGVILATARLDDSLPASLRARGVPHVLALRTDRVSPSSLGDDEAGGYLAVRHLLDLGHTDVGIVAGPGFTSSGIDRLVGAERALAEAGRRPGEGRVISVGYGLDHGIAAGHALLDRADRPTAVFAANDNLAIGVLTVASTLGLVAGRDLSIIGYNDIPLVSKLPVPLTSVRTPFAQIASSAVDLLLASPEPADRIRRTLPTLIPRASTARA